MDNISLEQLEEFDKWLTRIDLGEAQQSELDSWLESQPGGEEIPFAYLAAILIDTP